MSFLIGSRVMYAIDQPFDDLHRSGRSPEADIMSNVNTRSIPVVPADPPVGSGLWLVVFFIALLLPISFDLAGIRLSPLRLFVLCALVPLLLLYVQGRAGRKVAADWLFLCFSAWIVLSMVVNHGAGRFPLAIAFASETAACYLLGRMLVRGPKSYARIFSVVAIVLCVLLGPALFELFTGRLIISDMFAPVFDVIQRGVSADKGRLGLNRVYTVFGHPILFGIFCATMVSNFALVLNSGKALRWVAVLLAIFMTFMSLSSAPLLAIVAQLGLLAWWKLTRGAWWTLAALVLGAYVFVDVVASRSPLSILFSYATFDPHSGWIRIAIFDYGSQAAMSSPIFGIGLKPWAKPDWVPNSVDNFWLVVAMRYGLVGLALFVLGLAMHFAAICRAHITDPRAARFRIAYLTALAALALTLATVHVWDSAYAFVVFLIGAGSWFYTSDLSAGSELITAQDATKQREPMPFSRFTTTPVRSRR